MSRTPINPPTYLVIDQNFDIFLDCFWMFLGPFNFLGSSPNRGPSPVEWGDFPSVRSFVLSPPLGHPARSEAQSTRSEALPASLLSLRLQACLAGPQAWLGDGWTDERTESPPILQDFGWLAGWASDLAGWASGLAGWASGLAGWPRGGDERTNERTENLPILQDFVPYRGRCPASPHENQGESRAGQGNR